MEPAIDLAGMDVDQLKEALSKAGDALEDVEEEREFTLGQTGVHIGANELARMRRAWERDEAGLRERIEAITARLAELQSTP